MALFGLRIDQEIPISVTFTDDQGNPATVQSIPHWINSDDTIITIVPADDGMSSVVVPVGPFGVAKAAIMVDGHFFNNVVQLEILEQASPGDFTTILDAEMGFTTLKAIISAGPARMQPVP